ncbi:MAG TPA: RluA family pseudouridine synthase [Candidatus Moranbacteria bacterium]|nr:RluA family pseudouridine synthase [Candidatus Moranbacteria bacterium]HRZ33569.1 RluA family pseudouridine synthase [Candidatus Moranbacteria bacterium]
MQNIVVKKKFADIRLDKFLSKEFFSHTRGEIIKKIKEEKISVNGKKTKPSYILKENDIVGLKNFSKEGADKKLIKNSKIPLEIIFENSDIVVINKQAGIQVHPSHNEKINTIANALLAHFPEIAKVHDDSVGGESRPGIVHRLDKDTSGVMVIARNKKTFNELKKKFKDRSISKKYVAICEGIFEKKQGVIKKPIARSSNYRKQIIAKKNTKTKIRPAETEYKVIKESKEYSFVEVVPKTGRMHQIRLHLASMGHPVVGDLLYKNRGDKDKAKRQLLHAEKLEFEIFNKKYTFLVPLPQDFIDFLANID